MQSIRPHTTLIGALSLACFTPMAHADGWLLEAGLGQTKAKTDIVFPGWFKDQPSDRNVVETVAAGYSTAPGDFRLSAKLFYTPGQQQAGTTFQDSSSIPAETGDRVQMQLRNTWGFAIEPGVAVGSAGLAYLKLGYAQAKGNWEFSRPTVPDRYSGSATFSGPVWGLGYRHTLSPKLYGFAEFSQINYRNKDITMSINNSGTLDRYVDHFKPGNSLTAIGIGWQFD
jgi:hypothetical protein